MEPYVRGLDGHRTVFLVLNGDQSILCSRDFTAHYAVALCVSRDGVALSDGIACLRVQGLAGVATP
jgi:hypothetical protein